MEIIGMIRTVSRIPVRNKPLEPISVAQSQIVPW
jgi:hypothetical protein